MSVTEQSDRAVRLTEPATDEDPMLEEEPAGLTDERTRLEERRRDAYRVG